jgi:hypothetical protein
VVRFISREKFRKEKYIMVKEIKKWIDEFVSVHNEENINGAKMNFGLCSLVLVQRLSKLNNASKVLKEKGYYDNWSKENLDDVVTWRTYNR